MVHASIVRASDWPSRSTMSPRSGVKVERPALAPGMVAERREIEQAQTMSAMIPP